MAYDVKLAEAFFRARTTFTTGVHELERLLDGDGDPAQGPGESRGGYQIVDVRYPRDFANGHVPGAINLPKGKWQNPRDLRKDATLYVYCYTPTCHLAAEAAAELTAQGYKVVEVEGGWERWVQDGFAIEAKAA
ncbi:MAG: rhodanese-like domain-containing protein [Gammaproteobacteria bacterium]|nr:rhodanese-like domain-containing protein [Gammaproteobacteria bacterium]